jgi:hypothetical protein
LEIYLAAATDVDQPCEVAVFRSMRDGHTERVNEGKNNDQQGVQSK